VEHAHAAQVEGGLEGVVHVVIRLARCARSAMLLSMAALSTACGGGGIPASTDTTPPTLSITSSAAGTSATGPVTLTFTWSEDVGTSFSRDDVAVSGGSGGPWIRIDALRYTLVVTPPDGAAGSFQVSVATGRASDLAGNANAAPAALAQPYDLRLVGWTLDWSDEFETDGLPDAAKWDYDTERNAVGWFNNELQYYSRARLENARVEGGQLVITARKEDLASAPDYGGQRYTSARLVTRGKASWTYGFIEARAKLPCSRGTWPAIWTLGTGGRWPEDGEIDILEQRGGDKSRVLGTVHTRAYNYFNGSRGVGQGSSTLLPNACTEFNRYQLTWTPQSIRIGVNDTVYMVYDKPAISDATVWPFDNPQYLILNIAMGGDLGGAVDPGFTTDRMEVDYVRVYRR
jgi:beta-glucanase (GH16 family)